jgi:uncharacterized protein YndB with AHSA1/START domain
MSNRGLIAKASVTINAHIAWVWDALTDPRIIKEYMFGTEVVSDWKEGHPIVWKGTYEGKPYKDKGTILDIEAPHRLRVTHYSPLSGAADVQENYHTLTYMLTDKGDSTHIELSQDKNATDEERDHSQQMWEKMLESMKRVVEKNHHSV